MRSGIGPADHLADTGIPVVVDLPGVGANLADHPGVDFDAGWRGDGTSGPTPAFDRDLPEQPIGTGRPAGPHVLADGPRCRRPGLLPRPDPAETRFARHRSPSISRSRRSTRGSRCPASAMPLTWSDWRRPTNVPSRSRTIPSSDRSAASLHPTCRPIAPRSSGASWRTPTRCRTLSGRAGWARRRQTATSSITSDASTGSTGST